MKREIFQSVKILKIVRRKQVYLYISVCKDHTHLTTIQENQLFLSGKLSLVQSEKGIGLKFTISNLIFLPLIPSDYQETCPVATNFFSK